MSPLPLAISLGDPAGIGPELTVEAWARREDAGLAPFAVIGGGNILREAARTRGIELPIANISDPCETKAAFPTSLPVLGEMNGDYRPGAPGLDGARIARASLEQATELALRGRVGAVVTAPVAKKALAATGFAFPGQTEFLAHACGLPAADAVMMLAGPHLRTVPLTVHVSLASVPQSLFPELIARRAIIVAEALSRDFGIAKPRLAIAGLNPHAGEGGAFGDEEARIIVPAIDTLKKAGIDATGPHSADALFTPRARTTYDAALCMYHDQALIPIKAIDFDEGVNVTLGLPIVRTSPDHGTAFDIAGRKIADPGALIAAIRMAGQCAARRHGT